MGSGRVWYNDMLVEGGDRAYYSESELELWWVNIPLSISGKKRGVRVYYSDQVVEEQNSAATQRHNELRERFATPPIATVLQLLGEDKL
ncbi:hypothetical protein T03_9919 [Trichinella britovi]|uniref:Uncharacterized protein n=1 Tax=Trichinella britovi TaxID=45882 RepID=A0A0V1CY96_TRIBR|nr:hypothetical protein T03_9919 [Trichinella britovi]